MQVKNLKIFFHAFKGEMNAESAWNTGKHHYRVEKYIHKMLPAPVFLAIFMYID